jgi:hypothetical protein
MAPPLAVAPRTQLGQCGQKEAKEQYYADAVSIALFHCRCVDLDNFLSSDPGDFLG